MTTNILVLVHPGSACGSADFNIGQAASTARSNLIHELDTWQGGIVVIHGGLCDELPYYPALKKAIASALDKAEREGRAALRCEGEDPEQVDRIEEFIAQLTPEQRAAASFVVTGAWFDSEGGGCVGSVHEKIVQLGCAGQVSESAVKFENEEPIEGEAFVQGQD